MNKKAIIVGAGMAGCFMAVCLAKKGFEVEVYEYRPDVRKENFDSGRSFNLTLYFRGIQAMKQTGIWEEAKKIAIVAQGNAAHYGEKKIVYDPFDAQGTEVLYTVHRNQLNGALIKSAEKYHNIKFFFNTKCVKIDNSTKTVFFEGQQPFKIKTDLVVGADGIHSVVRSQITESKKDLCRKELEKWGYKEVHVSPALTETMKLRTKATHTWPRPDSLLIAFPNPDDSFTLMFNLPLEGAKSFAELTTKERIETYISQDFPDLKPLIPEIVHSFLHRPTGNFVTLYTDMWHDKDFIVLIGDAAHAVIPFYGQGMCAAFEDCLKLMELYDKHDGDWQTIFPLYQKNRKKNTDILARLSKENFIELRDKSRSAFFTLKDKRDTLLHKLFPELWQPPLYVLIAHGSLEYLEALRRYQRQERWSRKYGLDILLHALALPWELGEKLRQIR